MRTTPCPMKYHCLATALLLSLLPVVARGDSVQDWEARQGPPVKGSFVRLTKITLDLLRDGEEIKIPRETLSAASLDAARKLENDRKARLITLIVAMDFTRIRAEGITFEMGAPKEADTLREDEPYHWVKLTRSFFLKSTEVTWDEWRQVRELAKGYRYDDLGQGRNGFDGDASGSHPVTEVSWWDAVKWCNLKSEIENKRPVYHHSPELEPGTVLRTGGSAIFMDPKADGYRLPTEAEWEFAAQNVQIQRVRAKARGPDAWSRLNSRGNTHAVRTLESPSGQLLHDMLGNVAEWVWDRRGTLNFTGHDTDPSGPETGAFRIYRGGSWADAPFCCRPSYRGDYSPAMPKAFFIGFRPARNAPPSR